MDRKEAIFLLKGLATARSIHWEIPGVNAEFEALKMAIESLEADAPGTIISNTVVLSKEAYTDLVDRATKYSDLVDSPEINVGSIDCIDRNYFLLDLLLKAQGEKDVSIKWLEEYINSLPPVTPQPKTGHWIEIAKYSDGNHKIECSECGSHIFDRGHANSFNVKNKYKYCPNCGIKMVESQERNDEK